MGELLETLAKVLMAFLQWLGLQVGRELAPDLFPILFFGALVGMLLFSLLLELQDFVRGGNTDEPPEWVLIPMALACWGGGCWILVAIFN